MGAEARARSRRTPGVGTLELGVRKSDASVAEARITDAAGTTTRILFSGERRNVTLEADSLPLHAAARG